VRPQGGHALDVAELANRLEQAVKKPEGWLDVPHETDLAQVTSNKEGRRNVETAPDARGICPLISWVQAGERSEIVGSFDSKDAEDWLPGPARCGSLLPDFQRSETACSPLQHHGNQYSRVSVR
jgi:hypothetical protein